MSLATEHLSYDIEVLRALVASQAKVLETRELELKKREQEINRQKEEIAHLEDLLRLARHQKFAPSSERYVGQVLLFNEAEDELTKTPPPEDDDKVSVAGHTKQKPKRRPIPDYIPRETIPYDISEDEKVCPCCSKMLVAMGEVVSEQLDIVPAQVKVKRHVRKKYGCNHCKQVVRTAAMPLQPIPKSLASPGLLATICVNKYADGLPLHRQESILVRTGIDLGRATLSSWMVKLGELFTPLFNLLKDDLLDRNLIQMDETTVQVLKEPGRRAEKKSYVWVMASGRFGHAPPIILFHYNPSRSKAVPKELLGDWKGHLVTDGYDGYDAVVSANGLKHCGCFDHVRRKFSDAIKARPKGSPPGLADEALWYLKRLYDVERPVKDANAKRRLIVRNLYGRSILYHLKGWLDRVIDGVRPKSKTGEALHYLKREWPKLLRVLEDGDVPLSNELCENAIRPFVIGRKAWLFSASQVGATSSATIYSIIETAKANGHEPYAYLRYIIERLPLCSSLEDFTALLPYHLTPETCAQ